MCFSASVSFSAAAILIPVGIVCVKKAQGLKKPYWLIALLPLVFGIQQIFEGFVWLALDSSMQGELRLPALGFTFFSHLFWLFWIPLACYVVEANTVKKKIIFVFLMIGLVQGIMMYVPLWVYPEWLSIELAKNAIDYKVILLSDGFIPGIVARVSYAVIVLIPLLLSSNAEIRLFGVLIAISVIVSTIFYSYAFISIWCLFAALLSLYIFYIILRLSKSMTIEYE